MQPEDEDNGVDLVANVGVPRRAATTTREDGVPSQSRAGLAIYGLSRESASTHYATTLGGNVSD